MFKMRRISSFVFTLASNMVYVLFAFSGVAYLLKKSIIERHVIPYFNTFNGIVLTTQILPNCFPDITTIPFMAMCLLYLFAYVINYFYVMLAKMFSANDQVGAAFGHFYF